MYRFYIKLFCALHGLATNNYNNNLTTRHVIIQEDKILLIVYMNDMSFKHDQNRERERERERERVSITTLIRLCNVG